MKTSNHFRFSLSFLLILSLLSPLAIFASGNGKKHFNEGMNLRFGCFFEFDKIIALFSWEKVVGVNGVELGVHTIDPADALNQPRWIPRNVVIDNGV